MEDIDARNQEKRGSEIDGEGNGDVSNHIRPAANPRDNLSAPDGREHETLVVYTPSGWVDGGDFTKRDGDAENNNRDGDPTPDDICGPTTDERVEEGRSQTVGDRGQHKGHEGHLESGTVSLQFGFVAHGMEQLVGRVDIAIVGDALLAGAKELGGLVGGARALPMGQTGMGISVDGISGAGGGAVVGVKSRHDDNQARGA